MTWDARHLSVSIARPPSAVAAFAGDPRNLPAWSASHGASIREVRGRWVYEGEDREVVFTGPIEAGVLDHVLIGPDGERQYGYMRVIPNDAGSELVYTLFRHGDASDADFERAAENVAVDLETLRRILES